MKMRIVLSLILAALLLLSTGVSAFSGPGYQVEPGVISGGSYRLTSVEAQAETISAGGAYRLLAPSAPSLRGSGCCCTYLPCIQRKW